jgi:hypothetical protein
MKINLRSPENKREISKVRSQITDKVSLTKFDEFVSKNDIFDFNNDQHLQALRKPKYHCECTIDSAKIDGE